MTDFDDALRGALSETQAALAGIDQSQIVQACETIAGAGAIVLYGCGREGLMMRALAMRLHHLGCRVAMQGDMNCPPVGAGDLFLCSAGPGALSTVTALMQVAEQAGAKVLLLTAEPEADCAVHAGQTVLIPAQTMARDQGAGAGVLPMGSVYEAALFFLFEIMVLRLRDLLGQSSEAMRARHTNLE
ncbi:SIS domain-containing protein [Flavimaricola marinus]|uniref:3-hexulose-6-phosphate isomerase n=1 Tax=Flavimaricola marinus TaxID=1819565 RepID=A0A238LK43_9RHOB|nr:SIS domain-containing protein [Flavimaricola marinus]SMY09903.1 3-hexulose-6-phosphate isomerase [Flavimaricola marinus]